MVILFTFIVKSHGFFCQKMSLVQVNDRSTWKKLEENKSCVVLVTGLGCRACKRFKNPFYRLSREHGGVDVYEITVNDISIGTSMNRTIMTYTKKNGVKTIPSILFQKEESVSLIAGTEKNLDEIEKMFNELD